MHALKIVLKVLAVIALGIVIAILVITVTSLRTRVCDSGAVTLPPASVSVPKELADIPGYVRREAVSYLTFPEWYIVYSAREQASYLGAGKLPSGFPYLTSAAQFWCSYQKTTALAEQAGQVEFLDKVMLVVIGTSFSAEYEFKSLYENTLGRITELFGAVPEDAYYSAFAADYAKFLDTVPWYDYPFWPHFLELWGSPTSCPFNPRSCERRIIYSLEFIVKAGYGWAIGNATHATYSPADLEISLLVRAPLPASLASDARIHVVKTFDDSTEVITVPRYQEFTTLMQLFADKNVEVIDIAGGSNILVSALSPAGATYHLSGQQFSSMPLPTDPNTERILIVVPVNQLMELIRGMEVGTGVESIRLEHIYDY